MTIKENPNLPIDSLTNAMSSVDNVAASMYATDAATRKLAAMNTSIANKEGQLFTLDDEIISIDDGDTVTTKNNGVIRMSDIASTRPTRYDTNEIDHAEIKDINGVKSGFSMSKQREMAAKVLNKDLKDITDNDVFRVGEYNKRKLYNDLTKTDPNAVDDYTINNPVDPNIKYDGLNIPIKLKTKFDKDNVEGGRLIGTFVNPNTGQDVVASRANDVTMNAFAPKTSLSDTRSIGAKALDAGKAAVAGAVKGIVVDTADFIGDTFNWWDIGTEEQKTEMVNRKVGYSDYYHKQSQEEVKHQMSFIMDKYKKTGEVELADVYKTVKTAASDGENWGDSIGFIASLWTPGGAFTKIGKAKAAIEEGVKLGKFTKEEALLKMTNLEKDASYMSSIKNLNNLEAQAMSKFSLGDKVIDTAARNEGILRASANMTNDDIDKFKANNEGKDPSVSDVMRMYATNVFSNKLEYWTDLGILKDKGLATGVKEVLSSMSKKDVVNTGIGAVLATGSLGKNMVKEAGQEYVQTGLEQSNEKLNTSKYGNDLSKIITDDKTQLEMLTAAASGAAGGLQFNATGTAAYGAKGVSDALYNKAKGINNVDLTTKEGLDTFFSDIKTTQDAKLFEEDITSNMELTNSNIEAMSTVKDELSKVNNIDELKSAIVNNEVVAGAVNVFGKSLADSIVNFDPTKDDFNELKSSLNIRLDATTNALKEKNIMDAKVKEEFARRVDSNEHQLTEVQTIDPTENIQVTPDNQSTLEDLKTTFSNSSTTIDAIIDASSNSNIDLSTPEKQSAYVTAMKSALQASVAYDNSDADISKLSTPKEVNAYVKSLDSTKLKDTNSAYTADTAMSQRSKDGKASKVLEVVSRLASVVGMPGFTTNRSTAISSIEQRLSRLDNNSLDLLNQDRSTAATNLANAFKDSSGTAVVNQYSVGRLIAAETERRRKATSKKTQMASGKIGMGGINDTVKGLFGDIIDFTMKELAPKVVSGPALGEPVTYKGVEYTDLYKLNKEIQKDVFKAAKNASVDSLKVIDSLPEGNKVRLGNVFTSLVDDENARNTIFNDIKSILDKKIKEERTLTVADKIKIQNTIMYGEIKSSAHANAVRRMLDRLYTEGDKLLSKETYDILSNKLNKKILDSRGTINKNDNNALSSLDELLRDRITGKSNEDMAKSILDELSDEQKLNVFGSLTLSQNEMKELVLSEEELVQRFSTEIDSVFESIINISNVEGSGITDADLESKRELILKTLVDKYKNITSLCE